MGTVDLGIIERQPHELGLPFLVFIRVLQFKPTLSIFRRGGDCSGFEVC